MFITGYDKDEMAIQNQLKGNLLVFCNKPYDREKILSFFAKIRSNGTKIKLKTLSSFDLFVNDKIVNFQRSKSKELFALITDRQGSTVSIGEAVAFFVGI